MKRLQRHALASLLMGAAAHCWALSEAPHEPLAVTDGPVVLALAANGTDLYAGGYFETWGPCTGNGVPLHAVTGRLAPGSPRFNRTVHVVIPDQAGGWYVGGEFSRANHAGRFALAHVLADGSLNPDFAPVVNGTVYTLRLAGDTLYVGGTFYEVGGHNRLHLAALNAATGEVRDWDPGADGAVRALAVSESIVYAGGDFDVVGGEARSRLAAVDRTTGTVTGWDPSPNGRVCALALDVGKLFVGGMFTRIGGEDRPYLAAVDTVTGVATGWNPAPNHWVFCMQLAADKGTLFIGGKFSAIGGFSRSRLGAVDTATGLPTDWGVDVQNDVNALALSPDETHVYFGGNFKVIGSGEGVPRSRLAAASTGGSGSLADWQPEAGNIVMAMAAQGDWVFAGGYFSSVNVTSRWGLAAMDTGTGTLLNWNPRVSDSAHGGTVCCMLIEGETLYIGGGFVEVGGLARTNLAAIDLVTGAPTDWAPVADGRVDEMAFSPDRQTLYIGGIFTNVNGAPRSYVAEVGRSDGQLTDWNPTVDNGEPGIISGLIVEGGLVYVCGGFTNVSLAARNRAAAIDRDTGTATAWNPNLNHGGLTLSRSSTNGVVYLGGAFTQVGGAARGHLAAVSTTTGEALDWDPRINGYPYHMATGPGGVLYVGGEFAGIGGALRFNVGAVEEATGLPTAWNPSANGNVYAVLPMGNAVAVGGQFSTIGSESRSRLAMFGEPDLGPDSDGDGLPDAWERAFFGCLSHDGTRDTDGDGLTDAEELSWGTNPCAWDTDGDEMSDGHEIVADTNPTNRLSVLRITGVDVGSSTTVHFEPGSTRRLYALQYRADLVSGTWTNIPGMTPAPGAGGPDTLVDDRSPDRIMLYRVTVELP